jgi:hypothetical protein
MIRLAVSFGAAMARPSKRYAGPCLHAVVTAARDAAGLRAQPFSTMAKPPSKRNRSGLSAQHLELNPAGRPRSTTVVIRRLDGGVIGT